MTIYRCVCPHCTAYINSAMYTMQNGDPDPVEWPEACERFFSQHVCGQDCGDGIERLSQFRQYEEEVNDGKTSGNEA